MRTLLYLSLVSLVLLPGCRARKPTTTSPTSARHVDPDAEAKGKATPKGGADKPATGGNKVGPKDGTKPGADVVAKEAPKAQPKAPAPVEPPAPSHESRQWQKEVKGRGDTEESAYADGLQEARKALSERLSQIQPNLTWAPGVEFLESMHLVRMIGKPEKGVIKGQPYCEMQLAVELSDAALREINERARLDNVEQRQHLTMLGLIAAMAVVAVVGGYLRLEEMTRGFYTGLLRLIALGALACAGAGLWVLH